MKYLWQSFKVIVLMTILTGVLYPLGITVVTQKLFPIQANGNLVIKNGNVVGSTLLSQKFESPKYFWPRPSSIDYNPIPSGATNLGPTSVDLKKQIEDRRAKLTAASDRANIEVPQDLITASGSGLDPHISPKAAHYQVVRVTNARGLNESGRNKVSALIDSLVEKRDLNVLGEPRVNVLKLNMALDSMK